MELSKKLELYADKKLKFIEENGLDAEVILQDDSDGKGPYIKEWNIDGIKKPDITKLQDYQESEYTSKFGEVKTDKQRIIDIEAEIVNLKNVKGVK